MRLVHQRLDLDQQRPRAFLRHQHAGAGDLLAVLRQEQRRRIGHLAQALLGHREHAELVDRAEAVLERAHQAEARVRVALEVEHRVDDVLEHARPGERAFLGDVADQDDAWCRCLAMRVSCAAHSRTCATEPGAEVSARNRGSGSNRSPPPPAFCAAAIAAWIFSSWISGSRCTSLRIQRQALGAQRDLLRRFLAADIERVLLLPTDAPAPAAAASTCRCPGSPPISTTPPCTRPPPSTRSNSPMPVGGRGTSAASTSASICTLPLAASALKRFLPPGAQPRPPFPPACSMRRNAGIGPATSAPARRIRCRCRSFLLLPCLPLIWSARNLIRPAHVCSVSIHADLRSIRQIATSDQMSAQFTLRSRHGWRASPETCPVGSQMPCDHPD